MMKHLVVFLAVCMLSAAMVRERRETNGTSIICAPQTPCGWQAYNPVTKEVQTTVINTYCICGEGLSCNIMEDATVSNTFVMKCSTPGEALSTD